MEINRRDLLTIVALSIIFFSLAAWNLGMTQTPITTTQLSSGQSFIVDLGSANDVKSVGLLLKDGHFNLTVSVGSPDNWQVITSNILYPYNHAQNEWSLEYYKWHEASVQQTTRYVKFAFDQAPSSAVIAEVSVISTDNQQILVASVDSLDSGNQNLASLIDEQDKVQYPVTYMTQTYFDEIYFVRTAEQYLKLQTPYEWTHPPLGKLIMASGITIFGFNPFGWRVMGVIFATLMIPLIYFLGKELLGTWIGGFASAFLLTFDFMHFTMARMATVDTYVVFFSLASQLFFLIYLKHVLKDGWSTPVLPLFWAILFFALGFSTKWLVLYGFAAQLAMLAALRLREVAKLKENLMAKINAFLDPPFSVVSGFLLVAGLVYFLTYIPDLLAGRTLPDVLGLQGAMYEYHSKLIATHSFSSVWWSWPLMFNPLDTATHVPLWLYVSSLPLSMKSTIVLLGNPAVWWVGFASLILVTAKAALDGFWKKLTKKPLEGTAGRIDLAAAFIAIIFFFQWLPYVLISRITFIYHFYVSVPFLCLAAAYFISKYWSSKWVKVAALAYFVGVAALFALFYPAISGTPAPTSSIDSLKWLSGWSF